MAAPGTGLNRARKVVLEGRQRQLDNARVKLAYKGADAGRPDDHTRIIGPVSEKFRRGRLPAPAKRGNQANWLAWTGCLLAHLPSANGIWVRQFAGVVPFSAPSSPTPTGAE